MVEFSLGDLNKEISEKSLFLDELKGKICETIVGQNQLINKILIGILADGHILIEGVPGLAKTLTVNTIAKLINTSFKRIQFTPDMLPADLIGTLIYNQKTGEFDTRKGPVFSNIILADEINRTPAKVQSALLEAMQEHQVTIGETSYQLERPFLVLATQNPIEQEGTYPLPEAQVDRFMFKLLVGYPEKNAERLVLRMNSNFEASGEITPLISSNKIIESQNLINKIYVDEKVEDYALNLIFATRNPSEYGLSDLDNIIDFGASPRATINLIRSAKARAFMDHRGFVTPEDIRYIGSDVLRHRIILTYEAEAEEITSDDIINRLFEVIEVP
tara:strand:- start:4265 stop:5260 length:996 start_codon:yes stop_codon:yes gene_type:complete